MGNRPSSAADAGVLQVSSARAAEIHPDVAALARLPVSRPLVSAANTSGGSGARAASQQSAVQSPPPRAQASSNSSSSSSSPSLPTSAETEVASTASAAEAASAHTLRLDPACVQALHDRVRSHLATSVDGILMSQHEMNDRVRALQMQSQAVATECTAVAADVDAFSAQLDALSDIHMTLQTAFAQTQRAIIGIESLRRMMPARPNGPIVESFADFHLRQCTLARSAATTDSEQDLIGLHTVTAPEPISKLVLSPERPAEKITSYSQVSTDQGHRP